MLQKISCLKQPLNQITPLWKTPVRNNSCLKSYYATLKKSPTYKVVFLRHGESFWNKEDRFTGWFDSDLTKDGQQQAKCAGHILKREDYKFDIAYTSVLSRSIETVCHVLHQMKMNHIPVVKSWRLNERHYGGFTGLNKYDTVEVFGEETVRCIRRGFKTKPPNMSRKHPLYITLRNDCRYAELVKKGVLPMGESLYQTMMRVVPYWLQEIVPKIKMNRRILIVGHGNSLRSLVKFLDKVSDDDIAKVEIPTGRPFQYTLDHNLMPIRGKGLHFLDDFGDEEANDCSFSDYSRVC